MQIIADSINNVVEHINDTSVLAKVKQDILALCSRHPLYPGVLE